MSLLVINVVVIVCGVSLLWSVSARSMGHNALGRVSVFGKSLAVVDLFGTLVIGIIMGVLSGCNVLLTIIWSFILGELMHVIFKIKTGLV